MRDLTQYFAYFEDIATRHKSILHTQNTPRFFRADIEEFEDAMRSKANFPALVALNPAFGSQAQSIKNIRLRYTGGIMLVNTVQDNGNPSERSTKETALIAIARDIMTKMVNDQEQYSLSAKAQVLPELDLSAFSLELIPQRYPSLCGVLMQFQFGDKLGLLDESRWNGVTHYTV